MFNKKVKIGTKLYGIMRPGGDEPICIHPDKQRAINNIDSTYSVLVEMEITKISVGHTHFCECEHMCCCTTN